MLEESAFALFRDIGRDLFLRGLVSSHAGNISIRAGREIFITRRGSMLGRITQGDLVKVDLDKPDPKASRASSEVVVHSAIYRNTGALAVVHAHPPYATLLSMLADELVPCDSEGSYLLKKVPVVSVEETIGSLEAAGLVSERLKDCRIVLMRGHGSFARGDTLEDAYMVTSSLDASAFYLYHLEAQRSKGSFPIKTRPGRGH
ncbi:MAG: aldolase [Syntrophorhabdales bacterium]|jgi:L-fuculose-phosphate aldolase